MTEENAETTPVGIPVPAIEPGAILAGPGWTLSEETKAALREIDENIGSARARLAGFLVD